jgi:hypothetical protein
VKRDSIPWGKNYNSLGKHESEENVRSQEGRNEQFKTIHNRGLIIVRVCLVKPRR